MNVDPVCRMPLLMQNVKAKSELDGKTYEFCSYTCKQRFESTPDRFIRRESLVQKP